MIQAKIRLTSSETEKQKRFLTFGQPHHSSPSAESTGQCDTHRDIISIPSVCSGGVRPPRHRVSTHARPDGQRRHFFPPPEE